MKWWCGNSLCSVQKLVLKTRSSISFFVYYICLKGSMFRWHFPNRFEISLFVYYKPRRPVTEKLSNTPVVSEASANLHSFVTECCVVRISWQYTSYGLFTEISKNWKYIWKEHNISYCHYIKLLNLDRKLNFFIFLSSNIESWKLLVNFK